MSEGYIHGFSEDERDRLVAQAELWRDRFLTPGLTYGTGERLLEIGCGVGAVLAVLGETFPRLELTGIDLVPSQIAAARDLLASRGVKAELHVADAAKLPFDDASFDHVYGVWVLELRAEARSTAFVASSDALPFESLPRRRTKKRLASTRRPPRTASIVVDRGDVSRSCRPSPARA
jgi:cyclopropane fatty-acyl-phospholipid synthase-like methyltransferase